MPFLHVLVVVSLYILVDYSEFQRSARVSLVGHDFLRFFFEDIFHNKQVDYA